MPFISDEDAQALGKGTVRLAVFVHVVLDPTPLRLWFGLGDFEIGADAIDTTGGVYRGLGELNGLPVLSQLINGVCERVEFSISGVSAEALRLADEDADEVRGASVHVGLSGLDRDFQPLTAPMWLWEGEADTPRFSWDTSSDPQVRTISLSVGSAMMGRRRPRYRNFTGVEQRRISADDAFCDRVPVYSRGSTRKWP